MALCILTALLFASWPAYAANLADLAGPLRTLAALDRAGALNPADPLARMMGVQNGRLLVEVRFADPAYGEVANLTRLGARVHRTSDTRIEAVVPISRLVDIAALPTVAQVNLPEYMTPLQIPPTVSEGAQLTNALSLQAAGLTGLGVKVAVIDIGFQGYTAAELPPNVVARSFRADGIIDGITDHGTAVAEVIGDMAPNVDIYLLAIATSSDVEAALEFCIQNDIDVANMSIGNFEGPFDGTHSTDKAVNRARQAGILPVVSAGNHAQKHWSGDWADTDGDSLLEFDTQDEGISVTTTAAGQPVVVYLSWFETAGPTGTRADLTDRDYDIELVDPLGTVIASSAVTQNGNDPPTELLFAIAGAAGAYDVRVRAMSPNIATGPTDHFQFFARDLDLETTLQVPENSLLTPGTASGSLTTGATRAVAVLPAPIINFPVDTLEPFSSQGPTVDGRDKPEMCGPDGVQTSTTQNPFFGTSAAAPHVTGGAALLKGEDATRTPQELSDVLIRLAQAQNDITPIRLPGGTLADTDQCGAGRLSLRSGLDTKPPMVSITFPVNGTTITTAQPTIVGVITDTETGVDQGTIVLALDGVDVGWDSFNPGSGVVTFTPPSPLSRSAHTVTLVASDLAGNAGTPAIANFRVGLPMLSAGLHMISLPYRNLINPDPPSIFGLNAAELGLARWVPTDTAFGSKYHVWPDPFASFEPQDTQVATPTVDSPPAGLGYFVRLPREVVLNVAGETLSDVTDYTIRLPLGTGEPTGWHMIGNPFQDTVFWSTVQFVTNNVRQSLDEAIASGVTEGILFEFISGGGGGSGRYDFVEPQAAVLEPMKGYWLHVARSTSVTIFPATVGGFSAESKPADKPTPTLDSWQAQIIASAPRMLDTCNYLGVAPNASSGRDFAGDVPEPPAVGDALRLYFPHDDWGDDSGQYTRDLKARGAAAQEWEFEVACPTDGARVSLTWPEVNATVPAGLELRLEDLDSGRTVFMRGVTSYSFKASGVRHLKITASRAGAAGLRITTLAAAQARDGNIVVSYELSASASVTAEIRNIAGRLVRDLVVDRNLAQGAQTLTWDARNSTGVRVPAGTYLLQLTAKAADGQTVRRICPINAAR